MFAGTAPPPPPPHPGVALVHSAYLPPLLSSLNPFAGSQRWIMATPFARAVLDDAVPRRCPAKIVTLSLISRRPRRPDPCFLPQNVWTGRALAPKFWLRFRCARERGGPGGATPAGPAARNLGQCRGAGETVPFCTCGPLTAQWTCAFGAHLGPSHASRCIPSYFLHTKFRYNNAVLVTRTPLPRPPRRLRCAGSAPSGRRACDAFRSNTHVKCAPPPSPLSPRRAARAPAPPLTRSSSGFTKVIADPRAADAEAQDPGIAAPGPIEQTVYVTPLLRQIATLLVLLRAEMQVRICAAGARGGAPGAPGDLPAPAKPFLGPAASRGRQRLPRGRDGVALPLDASPGI